MLDTTSPWHLLGAGNMGTLAARYLMRAGFPVTVVRGDGPPTLEKTLDFADGRAAETLRLPRVASPMAPIRRLLVACKTPYSAAALDGLPLAGDVLVLRLQNGLGSLDGLLPAGATLIEVVTTSAVKGTHPRHTLVAENNTWMGPASDAAAPAWFAPLAAHWPRLAWAAPIHHRQWHKLVINAVINPLTGLFDLPNGALLEEPDLRARMAALAEEADSLLARLDPGWPGHSLAAVEAVARATAANTSSMRADLRRSAPTEIDAINGWLLRRAAEMGLDLPAHREIVAAVKARSGWSHRDR